MDFELQRVDCILDFFLFLGTIDAAEIKESFQRLGINIEKSEAEKLLKRYTINNASVY